MANIQPNNTATADTVRKPATRVVPFDESMRDQVFALYEDVFGADAAVKYRDRWNWSQVENLYPDLTRHWVVLSGERVVGFLGTIPVPYNIGGKPYIAHTTCDFMVHPDARFYGIKLMKQFFAECENLVAADDVDATIKVTTWLGAQDVGEMKRFIRIVDARALRKRQLKRIPLGFFRAENPLLRTFNMLKFRPAGKGIAVTDIKEFDERFERLYRRQVGPQQATVARDLRYMEWRYGKASPQSERRIGIVTGSDGDLEGYVVLLGQTDPKGNRRGRILDLHAVGDRKHEVTSALMRFAVNTLRESGAWAVVIHSVTGEHSATENILKSHGFVHRSGHRLLVKLRDDEAMQIAASDSNWSYTYGDSEASHAVGKDYLVG
jgi:hypothetical protein